MAKSKAKYYVVWQGRKPGIYDSWAACEVQVKGYPGAQFKAFPTRAMAEAAWKQPYEAYVGQDTAAQQWLFAPHPPQTPCLCVDAACAGVPGPLEYRGVRLPENEIVFAQGPYPNGTNNIGEFLALVHALAYLRRQDLNWPVYSDSRVAIGWVRTGKCGTDQIPDAENAPLFDLIARAEKWLAEHPEHAPVRKWDTQAWGEIPADFGRK